MKIVTAAEMRDIDRLTTERASVPSLTLMENAGTAVAAAVMSLPGRVVVVCGKGNNGGDGLVAARKQHEAGREVQVVLLAQPPDVKGDAAEMLRRLPFKPVVATTVERVKSSIADADIVVDAILGTGFTPPVSELYAAAIAAINASGAYVIAVDLPSGVFADSMSVAEPRCRAGQIVTFTALKPAHLFSFAQTPTSVADIGSPPEIVQSQLGYQAITARDFRSLLAPRDPAGHKGTYGHVLVVGGLIGKAGAPAMAAMAALRSGAGLVTVACPRSVLPTIAGFAPELMTEPLDETSQGTISTSALRRVLELARSRDVLVIGPGLSRNFETQRFIQALIAQVEKPIVLDADGLNAFEGRAETLKDAAAKLVLTPHPGEMSRLTGQSTQDIAENRTATARDLAATSGATVLSKGRNTVVAFPDGDAWLNPTGNPGMATGGTGDVLAGMLGAFLAQNQAVQKEAVLASVFLHGLAGDFAAADVGEISMTATDLISRIPRAIRQVQSFPPERIW